MALLTAAHDGGLCGVEHPSGRDLRRRCGRRRIALRSAGRFLVGYGQSSVGNRSATSDQVVGSWITNASFAVALAARVALLNMFITRLEFAEQWARSARRSHRAFSICVVGRGRGVPDQALKLLSMVRTWS
ncbi:hypothetical protein ACQP1W_18975 [Spirillospora sp. CA-255316]